VDIIVVLAHIAPQWPPELSQIYKAIRSVYSTKPFILLSGHSHLKYFAQYDANAFTLESGCYFQTLGRIDFNLGDDGSLQNLATEWMDTSLDAFYAWSNTTAETFLTPEGAAVKQVIEKYYDLLKLNDTFGCSPQTYSPYVAQTEANSLYKLYIESVIPAEVFIPNLDNNPQYFLCNPYTLRSELYEGRISRNDIYSCDPFDETYFYFKDVNGRHLYDMMNSLNAVAYSAGLTKIRNSHGQLSLGVTDWFHTDLYIDFDDDYDVVCSNYDGVDIQKAFKVLYPNETYTLLAYPNPIGSFDTWGNWILKNFVC